ncbi:MAG: serine protease [Candidatus Pacebacteria bacterium]|nr:serine protease [Candidatus Paceibacterota bacterium]
MPSWGEILVELNNTKNQFGGPDIDAVRRKYLVGLHAYTKRPTIIYTSRWVTPITGADPSSLSVSIADIQGLMEVMKGIAGTELDLVIHSPGGSIDAAEAFVTYIRSKFTHVRAIVPYAAMSAATMICMSCDEVVMGKHSFLGPIDPQFVMQTQLGPRMVPAQAIVEQFEKAQEEIKNDQTKLASWVPMLGQYGPDLLIQCENATQLSRQLVEQWLGKYMFSGDNAKANEVASWLAKHGEHKTHSRYLDRAKLEAKGIKIVKLEDDQAFQDAVLSLYHAVTLTFQNSVVAKLIENHMGKVFMLMTAFQPMPQPKAVALTFPFVVPGMPPDAPPPPA